MYDFGLNSGIIAIDLGGIKLLRYIRLQTEAIVSLEMKGSIPLSSLNFEHFVASKNRSRYIKQLFVKISTSDLQYEVNSSFKIKILFSFHFIPF